MITVNYRPHVPMEQDILVGILLAMHMGNDIPEGGRGSGLKWCPLRNELTYTVCTVTRVSTRRTTRGHCRQDIPLGTYDRKQQRWTLKGNQTEVEYLMKLIRRGDDVSLAILEKIRASPWKARPPNVRQTIRNCEERDDPWEDISQEDCSSEMSEDIPQADIPPEDLHSPPRTQFLRKRGDLTVWQDLIGSILEEQKIVNPAHEEGTGRPGGSTGNECVF
jgi:hypothetical protein